MAQFIADNYIDPLRKEDIARVVGLNPSYAIRLFHRVFGERPVDYLIRYRIAHAQRLLVSTNKSILDIALESGFGSLSNFYLAFKRICSQTPNEFRKPLQKKELF